MYQEIFTKEQLQNEENLVYNINKSGCSIKLQNQSAYALDIYYGTNLLERIMPFNSAIIPNSDVQVRINKSIKAKLEQEYQFVAFKTITGEVKNEEGSQSFTGTLSVEGDMNITNSQFDVNVVAPVEANITNSEINVKGEVGISGPVEATITNSEIQVSGDINIANTPNVEINNVVKTETNITNAEIPIVANAPLDVNIQNATIPITGEVSIASGVIEANINNAQIQTELVNASISTNPVVPFGKGYQDKWELIGEKGFLPEYRVKIHENAGLYDTIVITMSTIVYRERENSILSGPMYDEETSSVGFLLSGMPDFSTSDAEITYQEFMGEEGVSLFEVIGTGSKTRYTRDVARGQYTVKAKKPFLFNTLDLKLRFGTPTIIAENGDKVYCKLNAFVYNSKSFNNIKEGGDATLSYLNMNGGVNMNNKSISNIDGLFFNDATDGGLEGINFPKTTGGSDIFKVLNGQMLLNGTVAYEELVTVYVALNLNTLNKNGTFYSHSVTEALGKPKQTTTSAAFITHKERTGGYAIQTWENATTELQIFIRRKTAGVWGEWKQIQLI